MADDTPMNFFSQSPRPVGTTEPPPPSSEDDYGDNVVALPPRKRAREGWRHEWHTSNSGSPLPTLYNALLALRNHEKFANAIRYDEMACQVVITARLPGVEDAPLPRVVRDADVLAIQEEMQVIGLRRVAKSTVQDAIERRAEEQRFHPIREYLATLEWDGEKRIAGWLSRYLGVEGGPYADTIGRLFLLALIARVMRPGCKVDYMLILEGPQGEGKSTACRILAGDWFSDNLPDLSRGDAVRLSMHLRGKWLIEIAEMSSFNSAEAHTLKEFLTQTEERYTPKYGRNEVREPRQCLFVGTTNEGAYLRDATGARRFWPVKVGTLDLEALAADRDQLLAEALVEFRAGAKWWPDRDFEREHIAPEQDARYEADPWETMVGAWLETNQRTRVTVNEILLDALGFDRTRIGTREQRRVSAILQRLGMIMQRETDGRFYVRGKSLNSLI